MKKISVIAMLLLVVMLIASCGKPAANESAYKDSLEVINTVWSAYPEADKFPVGGGDSANMSMEGPAKFDHTNKEELDVTLALPASEAEKIDDAASMMHMMNANTFTAGVYRLVDGTDAEAFANAYKSNLDNRRWMCGFPEKFIVINTGSYVITAFGNGQVIDTFKATATEKLDSAKVVLEGNIEA
ncbi:MAG: hypothetical protein IKM48_02210 [Clostridia bacterium]|nr:hypothetical protein [Clostridia bacterium]